MLVNTLSSEDLLPWIVSSRIRLCFISSQSIVEEAPEFSQTPERVKESLTPVTTDSYMCGCAHVRTSGTNSHGRRGHSLLRTSSRTPEACKCKPGRRRAGFTHHGGDTGPPLWVACGLCRRDTQVRPRPRQPHILAAEVRHEEER